MSSDMGDTDFELRDRKHMFRFAVHLSADEKLVLWLEDRVSKRQWRTDPIDVSSFVTPDNAIPGVSIADYAEAGVGDFDKSEVYSVEWG
ncbi:hypothetical protein P43SY_005480 [Pythium insidiosum]|uniref:Uncharacterized protein n=1 Tax=Pythium insidiosum TaxID=114742 RepID=A0AAD5Q479_PYTIN|nr:hypothetical protein P43SY_005480 [Pythium insidiosum]